MKTERARRVVVLGSTGSIGRQTIDVVLAHPERFSLSGLVAGSDGAALEEQVAATGVAMSGLGSDEAVRMAAHDDADIVVNAVVGAAGLRASVAALRAGKRLALANKESLVAGGEVCLAAAASGGGEIVAVDSEHAAIAQCLQEQDIIEVERIVLTASGGPFRGRRDLTGVAPEDALAHPTWSMGPKITIDCATLMNKGLEVIEAHHLFSLAYECIDVVVHPQSVVHGMVEMVDGSVIMQAAPTDMRTPIQAALAWPERIAPAYSRVDLAAVGSLDFEPVDHGRFPSLGLAYRAGEAGRTFPAALNAANEVAVAAFLDRRISFQDIPAIVQTVLDAHEPQDASDLESVMEVDAWARRAADEAMTDASMSASGSQV
ncbi:MAG: 1-deoxy-D-xylulose-5-phosphate reductoisomerase [Actinomycetota bacterium]